MLQQHLLHATDVCRRSEVDHTIEARIAAEILVNIPAAQVRGSDAASSSDSAADIPGEPGLFELEVREDSASFADVSQARRGCWAAEVGMGMREVD